MIVFARTGRHRGPTRHHVLSARPTRPSRWQGEKKCSLHSTSTTDILIDGRGSAPTGCSARSGDGFAIAMDTLDGGRIGIAAQAVGIAQACLDAPRLLEGAGAVRQPIANFQAIQWKLADMSTEIDAARMLTSERRGCATARQRSQAAAQAEAVRVADGRPRRRGRDPGAGGDGYTDHFPVERLFRDARITEIYEGATDIQRIVIARSILATHERTLAGVEG